MSKRKRLPNFSIWKVDDALARLSVIAYLCKRLLKVLSNPDMKMTVMEIQLAAQEATNDLMCAKEPEAFKDQEG